MIYNIASEIFCSKFYTSVKFHGERLIGGDSFQYIPRGRRRWILYCNISVNSEYSAYSEIQVSWTCGYLLLPPHILSVKLYCWDFPSVTSEFNHRKLTAFQKSPARGTVTSRSLEQFSCLGLRVMEKSILSTHVRNSGWMSPLMPPQLLTRSSWLWFRLENLG